ncbi:MAG: PKD domain-containing protein, partial [Candidatus Kapaibacterium sp.]
MRILLIAFAAMLLSAFNSDAAEWLDRGRYYMLDQDFIRMKEVDFRRGHNQFYVLDSDTIARLYDFESGGLVQSFKLPVYRDPRPQHVSVYRTAINKDFETYNDNTSNNILRSYTIPDGEFVRQYISGVYENWFTGEPYYVTYDYNSAEKKSIELLSLEYTLRYPSRGRTGFLRIIYFTGSDSVMHSHGTGFLDDFAISKNENFFATTGMSSFGYSQAGVYYYNEYSEFYIFDKNLGLIKNGGDSLTRMAFSHDESLLAGVSGRYHRKVAIYSTADGALVDTCWPGFEPVNIQFSPDNRRLILIDFVNTTLAIYDRELRIVTDTMQLPQIGGLKPAPDGRSFALFTSTHAYKIVPELLQDEPYIAFVSDIQKARVGDSVRFYDGSNFDMLLRRWSFGDGRQSGDKHPIHIYDQPGIFSVELSGRHGVESMNREKENYIEILPALIPDFTASVVSGNPPLNVEFTNKSEGRIDSLRWTFSNGDTLYSQNAETTFEAPGNYVVTLTIWDKFGSKSKSITINVKFPDLDTEYFENESILSYPGVTAQGVSVLEHYAGTFYVGFRKNDIGGGNALAGLVKFDERLDSAWTRYFTYSRIEPEVYPIYDGKVMVCGENIDTLNQIGVAVTPEGNREDRIYYTSVGWNKLRQGSFHPKGRNGFWVSYARWSVDFQPQGWSHVVIIGYDSTLDSWDYHLFFHPPFGDYDSFADNSCIVSDTSTEYIYWGHAIDKSRYESYYHYGISLVSGKKVLAVEGGLIEQDQYQKIATNTYFVSCNEHNIYWMDKIPGRKSKEIFYTKTFAADTVIKYVVDIGRDRIAAAGSIGGHPAVMFFEWNSDLIKSVVVNNRLGRLNSMTLTDDGKLLATGFLNINS